MKKQSSIDWLIIEITQHQKTFYGTASIPITLIEQAKQMHKEEIEETFFQGAYGGDIISAEQYYNETFGGDNE